METKMEFVCGLSTAGERPSFSGNLPEKKEDRLRKHEYDKWNESLIRSGENERLQLYCARYPNQLRK